MERRHYTIAFDVSDARRRRRLTRLLKPYGLRVQFSVFECAIAPTALPALWGLLEREVDPDEDRLHLYAQCPHCRQEKQVLGVPLTASGLESWIL